MEITQLVERTRQDAQFEVDVSDLLGEEPRTTIFIYREPTWNELVHVTGQAHFSQYKRHFPDITEMMAMHIELLCICHVAPPILNLPPAEFYFLLSKQRPEIFARVLVPFQERLASLNELIKKSLPISEPGAAT